IAVCEGQTDDTGGWFGAELITKPGARDPLPANMGHVIAKLLWSRTGLRARAEKPGLLGRSCAALVSQTDRAEAWDCGAAAVRCAVEGRSGVMVAIRREAGPAYRSETFLVPLELVARRERAFPQEWINAQRNYVNERFVKWAEPLVGPVRPHFCLS